MKMLAATSSVMTMRPISARGIRVSMAPTVARAQLLRLRKRTSFVVSAEPDVEGAIKEAEEACESGSEAECATAWDTVEELSAAQSHNKAKEGVKDPLEEYCEEVPEADECRVYED